MSGQKLWSITKKSESLTFPYFECLMADSELCFPHIYLITVNDSGNGSDNCGFHIFKKLDVYLLCILTPV